MTTPDAARTGPSEAALEELLSRPTPPDVDAARGLHGDVLVLGCGGKMGPSLVRLVRRALDEAGAPGGVIGVARFSRPGLAEALARDGIPTIAGDLLDDAFVASLPDAPNVVLMAGQKFGSTEDPATTWATNTLLGALVARRYATSRLVVFSTGNVYPLAPVTTGGPTETDPVGPVGEYGASALGRERVLTFLSRRARTPMALLRLNYAIEPRYGVLRDLADRVWRRSPIDLTMGHVNIIWQRDANGIALRSFAHCAVPPCVVNLTGPETLSVRWLAERLGDRFGISPTFRGTEPPTALLSNAAHCRELFGPLSVSTEAMLDLVADWVLAGGRSLDMPTHYDEREGRF
jgi:nucleoside-diphosphate-sugar epimerase